MRTVTGTPSTTTASGRVGSRTGAATLSAPRFHTPVCDPSCSRIQPIRLSTPRTWARPSYSPAGELAAFAANGHCLPLTATVPNDCLSSTVPSIVDLPSLLLSARSDPDTVPSSHASIFLPSQT